MKQVLLEKNSLILLTLPILIYKPNKVTEYNIALFRS